MVGQSLLWEQRQPPPAPMCNHSHRANAGAEERWRVESAPRGDRRGLTSQPPARNSRQVLGLTHKPTGELSALRFTSVQIFQHGCSVSGPWDSKEQQCERFWALGHQLQGPPGATGAIVRQRHALVDAIMNSVQNNSQNHKQEPAVEESRRRQRRHSSWM